MKKILKLRKRRKNGGFTLVEVIVSCVLLGVLILAVMAMITPVMNVITLNENNANALMISEAVEAHIDRNIKNSLYCGVFTNVLPSSTAGAISEELTAAGGEIQKNGALKEMLTFLKTDENMKIYDVKIIGIRWLEDTRTHQYKYMLTNITSKVKDDGSCLIDFKEEKVFENCFYENMFPDIKFEVKSYDFKDSAGNVTETRNVALKTTAEVYSNSEMTALGASGTGYADFINIRTKSINPDGIYKLYSIAPDSDDTTFETEVRTDDVFKTGYPDAHPETYIVYVTRKLKYADPPASSSTPSSSSTP